jgi:hypothetical protein
MLTSLSLILVLAGGQQFVALPHAGRILNQNELSFHGEALLVQIEGDAFTKVDREVKSRSGLLKLPTWIVPAATMDGRALNLMFTEHLMHGSARLAASPGPEDVVAIPPPSGTYLALGRMATGEDVQVYASVSGYGFAVHSEKPPVYVLFAKASMPEQFEVFALIPTSARTIPDTGVLNTLVSALTLGSLENVEKTTRLLVHTNHTAFPDWKDQARPAAESLERPARQADPYPRARLLMAAAHMGLETVYQDALAAIVLSERTDPDRWTSPEALRLLTLAKLVPEFPTPAVRQQIENPASQRKLLSLAVEARSPRVKELVLGNMTRLPFDARRDQLLNLLLDAEPGSNLEWILLLRLSTWFEQPTLAPERSSGNDALVEHWRRFLSQDG